MCVTERERERQRGGGVNYWQKAPTIYMYAYTAVLVHVLYTRHCTIVPETLAKGVSWAEESSLRLSMTHNNTHSCRYHWWLGDGAQYYHYIY